MKRTIILIISGVLLAAAVWLLIEKRPSFQGPKYQERTAREWLKDAATTNQMKAFEAFHAMGSNAAPYLVHELERKDSVWDQFYQGIYLRLPAGIQKHLSRPWSEIVRWNSAEMMLVNVDARPVLPELVELLKDGTDEQQFCALRAIVNLISPADARYVPDLIESLQSANTVLRPLAAIALERIGPGARAAVPALTNLLDSQPEERLREWALRALQRIDPKAAGKYEIK